MRENTNRTNGRRATFAPGMCLPFRAAAATATRRSGARRLHQRVAMLTAMLVLATAATVRPLDAQRPGEDARGLQRAMRLLGSGDYDAARKVFWDELKLAESQNDRMSTARMYFYIGLAWHRQYSNIEEPRPANSKGLLDRAHKYYSEALRLNPDSAGGWNNLAQVNAMLSNDDEAEQNFQAAVRLGGSHQTTYLVNYADFLYQSARGDDAARYDEAAKYYELALQQQPNSQRARDGLDRYYREQHRENFGAKLWQMIQRGSTRQAMDSALEALDQPGWSDEQQIEFMASVARCLSFLRIDTVDQLPSELEDLAGHELVGEGAREIRRLYVGNRLTPDDYPWWSRQVARDESAKAPRGGWPQEAFTALINSRGDYFERREELEMAEKLYRLAYQLTPYHVDPQALIKLADLWVKRDQPEQLETFLRREEDRLFDEKSGAIRAMQHKRSYELHRALASVYTHLERWEDPTGYRNAEFQLKAALEDAQRYNESLDKDSNDKPIVDTHLIAKLSDRYKSRGEMAEAYRLQVFQADKLNQLGAVNAARDVFERVKVDDKPEGVDPRTERLRVDLEADLKSKTKLPFPEDGAGFGKLRPGGAEPDDSNRGSRTTWRQAGDPESLALWYPAESKLTRSQVVETISALEKLIAYDRRNVPQVPQKDGYVWASTKQLKELPDWMPANIKQVQCDDGTGRLEFEQDGKAVDLRFQAAGSPEFRYMRFSKEPAPRPNPDPRPDSKPRPDPNSRPKPDPRPDPDPQPAPRPQPETSLKWRSASQSKTLPSRRSSIESLIVFQNKSRQSVLIAWVDEKGRSSSYEQLRPGQSLRKTTRAGHCWRVTDQRRRELGSFIAARTPAWATIDDSHLASETNPAPQPTPRPDPQPTPERSPGRTDVELKNRLAWTSVKQGNAPASRRSLKRTVVAFENASKSTVLIYAVDSRGQRAEDAAGKLTPGKTKRQATISGHTWMVTDSQGRELGHFVADNDAALARIPASANSQ